MKRDIEFELKIAREKAEKKNTFEMLDAQWPSALIKAVGDPFSYYIRLKSGHELFFTHAKFINLDWVSLEEVNTRNPISESDPLFKRGLEVRVSEIALAADAPYERD